MGSSISILTLESYYYALSREKTKVTWGKHGTGIRYLRPIDTATDFEYHSHLSTTFNLRLN